MIATIHHMGLAWDLSMTDPHREDWLAVARSDPWKVTRAQAGFSGDATRRRRLLWVAGQTAGTRGGGRDCLRRDLHGEDCHHGREIYALAALSGAKIELG